MSNSLDATKVRELIDEQTNRLKLLTVNDLDLLDEAMGTLGMETGQERVRSVSSEIRSVIFEQVNE